MPSQRRGAASAKKPRVAGTMVVGRVPITPPTTPPGSEPNGNPPTTPGTPGGNGGNVEPDTLIGGCAVVSGDAPLATWWVLGLALLGVLVARRRRRRRY